MSGAVILAGGGGTPPEVPQTILRLAGGANARIVILAHTQQDVARGGTTLRRVFRRERRTECCRA
jgi:hypothetical protein